MCEVSSRQAGEQAIQASKPTKESTNKPKCKPKANQPTSTQTKSKKQNNKPTTNKGFGGEPAAAAAEREAQAKAQGYVSC
jgi:hypothetical protein